MTFLDECAHWQLRMLCTPFLASRQGKRLRRNLAAVALTLLSLAWLSAGVEAQEAKIAITPNAEAKSVGRGTVDIRLLDAQGRPVKASKDMAFDVNAPGTDRDKTRVVIPQGQTGTSLQVRRTSAALSELKVEGADPQSGVRGAVVPLGLAASPEYTPALPLAISLAVSPRPKLLAGLETATVIAALVDANNVPVAAPRDLQIRFPGSANVVQPNPLTIARGATYAEASAASSTPFELVSTPIIQPPLEGGRPITTSELKVTFEPPIAGTRVVSIWGRYVQTIRRPHVPIRLEFLDAQNNVVAADRDRTILVSVEPQTDGIVYPAEVTVNRGASFALATYIPLKPGKVTINPVASMLASTNATIEFQYRWAFFLLLALAGGLAGSCVRGYNTVNGVRKWILCLLGGALAGALVYVLAPLLVSLGLQPKELQGSPSRMFEAFVWGVIGGFLGLGGLQAILEKWKAKSVQAQPARVNP